MSLSESTDEESLFEEALCIEDLVHRQEFLERRCGTDIPLRRRIERLLAAYRKSEHLENPPIELVRSRTLLGDSSTSNLQGQMIGGFEVLEMIGEGGMGEVYLARSLSNNLSVALKVIKPGMDTRQVIARFALERETLKRMNHANIAGYIDAGVTEFGRAYFAMELVRGLPITEYCDRNRLSLAARLTIFMDVCSAVNHANNRGVVHRDLKPSNILVTQIDGTPTVKIIDFGVAKALTLTKNVDTRFTLAVQLLGTPEYMSPEQARFSSDVDARSDVFSLGVLLFELITGSTPMPKASLADCDFDGMRSQIIDEEAVFPSYRLAKSAQIDLAAICKTRSTEPRQYQRLVHGDLDWIVLKALEKRRENRYADPGKFAEDVKAFLEHRPVTACRPSLAVRAFKFGLRHRAAVSIAGVIGLLGLVVLAILSLSKRDTSESERLLFEASDKSRKHAETQLEHNEFVLDVQKIAELEHTGDSLLSAEILQKYSSTGDSKYANHFAIGYLRHQILRPSQIIEGHQHDILDMSTSPDGRWLASGDRGGDIFIWDQKLGTQVCRLHPSDREVTRTRFSPDGRWLATTGQDGLIRLWDVKDWSPIGELVQQQRTVNGLTWSPDSTRLASGNRDGIVRIWDVHSQTCIRTLSDHAGPIRCLEWSHGGTRLAAANGDDGVKVWDTEKWTMSFVESSVRKGTLAIAFSIDDRFMAFGGYFGELVIVDLKTNVVVQRAETQRQTWSLAFGEQNELLAGQSKGVLQVFQFSVLSKRWESERILEAGSPKSTLRSIQHLPFREFVAVASEEERRINVFSNSTINGYSHESCGSTVIGVVPELGATLCTDSVLIPSSTEESLKTERVNLPVSLVSHCSPTYSRLANLVAVASQGQEGDLVNLLRPGSWDLIAQANFPSRVRTLSFSRDGEQLAMSGDSGFIRIWNLRTNAMRDLSPGLSQGWARVACSPTDDLLLFTSPESLHVWRTDTWVKIRTVETKTPAHLIYYHPDGNCVFLGESGRFSVWTPDLSELLWASPSSATTEGRSVLSICVSPDQSTIASILNDGVVKLWDAKTHSQLFAVATPSNAVDRLWIVFSNSHTLCVGKENGRSFFLLEGISNPDNSQSP